MKKDDLVREMLDLVKDQTIQNNKIMALMLETQQAQSAVLQTWIEMFKPASEPIRSTSPDQRSTIKDLEDETAWEPVTMDVFANLMNEAAN